MNTKRLIKRVSLVLTMAFFVHAIPFVQAQTSVLFWQRIEGVVVPGTSAGGDNVVGGIMSVPLSWSANRGNARVNLQNGNVAFYGQGLVLAAQGQLDPAIGLVIGVPSPAVTMVKGTLVCNAHDPALATTFDTNPVPLSAQGSVYFSGQVGDLPSVCPNAAFLFRVADDNSIKDRWIAHGAVRIP